MSPMRRFAVTLALLAGCAQCSEAASSPARTAGGVPILELPERYMANGLGLTGEDEEDWYGINGSADGMEVYVHATNSYVEAVAEANSNAQVRGAWARATVDGEHRVISWAENDTTYSVGAKCLDESDVRCRDFTFVVDLANTLKPAP